MLRKAILAQSGLRPVGRDRNEALTSNQPQTAVIGGVRWALGF